MPIEPIWKAYAKGDAGARDRLIQDNLSLVHHVARQLSRALAAPADFDELVSCGTIGLMGAIEAFEPARGLSFSTFAVPRIRGAILDELRRQDHVPRSIRRKTRDIAQARETLTRIFGRPASDQELAEHLGIDLMTLWRWQADTEGAVHISIDQSTTDQDGSTGLPPELLSTEQQPSVEDDITADQEKELLKRALQGLKEQERIVLTLYYFEELKLHEIATVLDVTESRVSQIRSKALGRLRTHLGSFRHTAR